MYWSSSYQCSDSRDRVYAALGLTASRDLIQVNYNQSELELSTNTTRACLNSTQDLEILSLCFVSQMVDKPSWVVEIGTTEH
jgi:hypothetical protein